MSDTYDPYFTQTETDKVFMVTAARPITVRMSGVADSTKISVPDDKDLVVYGDDVTIQGRLIFHGGKDRRVTILARTLHTLPDDKGAVSVEVCGAPGTTSTNIHTGPPMTAATGSEAEPGIPDQDGCDCCQPDEYTEVDNRIQVHSQTGQDRDDNPNDWLPPFDWSKYDPNNPPPPPPTMHGNPGDPGGTADNGGTIDLRVGTPDTTGVALLLSVDGGRGGNGLQGQQGADGGRGGDSPFNTPGVETQCFRCSRWLNFFPGNGGRGGVGGDGGDAGAGGAPGTITLLLPGGGDSAFQCSLEAGTAGTPGLPGPGGRGGLAGSCNGTPAAESSRAESGSNGGSGHLPWSGMAGVATVTTTGTDSDLSAMLPQPALGYLTMMLERARASVLATSGAPTKDDTAALQWVVDLIAGYTVVDITEQPDIDALNKNVGALLGYGTNHLDVFGNPRNYAPLGDVAFHQTGFDKAVGALSGAQAAFKTAWNEANTPDTTSETDPLQGLRDTQSGYDNTADGLRSTIADLVERLRVGDDEAVDAQSALVDQATKDFKDAVESACGVRFMDFLEGMSQMVFFPERGPQQLVAGLVQTAKLVNLGMTTVVGDDGSRVPKEYLVRKVTQLTSVKGLSYQESAGQLVVPDGSIELLLADRKQFDDICEKFHSVEGAQPAEDAFDELVSAVQARNSDIVTINQTLAQLVECVAKSGQMGAAITAETERKAQGSKPGIPALADQYSRMAAQARDECVNQLYLASRAYWFWSLTTPDALAQALQGIEGHDPLVLDPTSLTTTSAKLYADLQTVIEQRLAKPRTPFPDLKDDPDQAPPTFEFTETTHPAVMHKLRKHHFAYVDVPLADATTPASDNPFGGWLDVRLSAVHVWVWGATTGNDTLRIDLMHTGTESLVSSEPPYSVAVVNHPAVYAVFQHGLTNGEPSDSSLKAAHTPPFEENVVAQDVGQGSMSVAALIGPFTRWKVSLDPANNDNLDTTGITKLRLQFYGSALGRTPATST